MIGTRALTGFGPVILWPLALALCAWVYWPGLDGPPILDDAVNLRPLQLLDEQPELAVDVVAGNLSGPLGRPLTMLSFSVEQVLLGGGPQEKKRVNLGLHLFIGCLLLLFCRDLFACLGQPRPLLLAALVASLWLFAPLLLSTVLYSVQRMAQLAALFSLLALWAFLRCRLSGAGFSRVAWAVLTVCALLAAPLGKENGLLALPLVMWLEWTVLRFSGFQPRARSLWLGAHRAVVIIGALGLAGVWIFLPEYLIGGYAGRDFDLTQRLLTQARIVWTYVGQLLWADSSLLGLYQDDQHLSEGLLVPLTTLAGLVGWALVAAATVWLARFRNTAGIAFGLGFFLIAHLMESTILPLELYFEHRNYLPAMGLFLALVSAGAWLVSRWGWCAGWLLVGWLGLAGHALGLTGAEAQLWSHNYLFHITAVNRFPGSLRANVEMSRILARGGDLEAALRYATRAEALERHHGLRQQLRRVNLHCLAGRAIEPRVIEGMSAVAADFRDDQVSELTYVLVKNIVEGACPATDLAALGDRLQQLTRVTQPRLVSPKYYVSMAILENHAQRYPQALARVDALLARTPDSVRGLMMKLYFTSVLEMEAEREATLARLRELETEGLLNRQQRYNLGLFTRPDNYKPEQ